MPRRRVVGKREVLPDPIYNSIMVTKFINGVMLKGKKSIAENLFYGAMGKVAEKTGEEWMADFFRNLTRSEIPRESGGKDRAVL